jgi:hypothetical protein
MTRFDIFILFGLFLICFVLPLASCTDGDGYGRHNYASQRLCKTRDANGNERWFNCP